MVGAKARQAELRCDAQRLCEILGAVAAAVGGDGGGKRAAAVGVVRVEVELQDARQQLFWVKVDLRS